MESRPGQQRRPIGSGQDALRERVEFVRLLDGRDRSGGVGVRSEPACGLPQDQVASGLQPAILLGRRIGFDEGVAFDVQVVLGGVDKRQHLGQCAVGFVQVADESDIPVHRNPDQFARVGVGLVSVQPLLD